MRRDGLETKPWSPFRPEAARLRMGGRREPQLGPRLGAGRQRGGLHGERCPNLSRLLQSLIDVPGPLVEGGQAKLGFLDRSLKGALCGIDGGGIFLLLTAQVHRGPCVVVLGFSSGRCPRVSDAASYVAYGNSEETSTNSVGQLPPAGRMVGAEQPGGAEQPWGSPLRWRHGWRLRKVTGGGRALGLQGVRGGVGERSDARGRRGGGRRLAFLGIRGRRRGRQSRIHSA